MIGKGGAWLEATRASIYTRCIMNHTVECSTVTGQDLVPEQASQGA